MFRHLKELTGDANRGLRAAKYFRRLDQLNARQDGLATRLRRPLIDAFVYERLTTDTIELITKRMIEADDPETLLAELLRSLQKQEEDDERETKPQQGREKVPPLPEIQGYEKLKLANQRFRQFTKIIGDNPPNEQQRIILENMRSEIEMLLNRQA